MIRTVALGLLSLSALAAPPAWAARPFTTDDAGVLERGACELEGYGASARQRGAPKLTRWWLQSSCGVGARTQLALGAGVDRGGGARSTGVGLFGKTALTAPSDAGVNVSLAYGASTARATGDRWRYQGGGAALIGTLRSGVSTWSANLGWNRDAVARQSSTTWALAWERPVATGLDAGVEVFGDDRESPWVGVGLRWAVADGWSLDTSLAQQTNSARTRLLTAGFKLGW